MRKTGISEGLKFAPNHKNILKPFRCWCAATDHPRTKTCYYVITNTLTLWTPLVVDTNRVCVCIVFRWVYNIMLWYTFRCVYRTRPYNIYVIMSPRMTREKCYFMNKTATRKYIYIYVCCLYSYTLYTFSGAEWNINIFWHVISFLTLENNNIISFKSNIFFRFEKK